MGTPQCRPWGSISYQATPAGPARPTGGKTLNKPHPKAGTDMENQPARHHQHDTEPIWAAMGGYWTRWSIQDMMEPGERSLGCWTM